MKKEVVVGTSFYMFLLILLPAIGLSYNETPRAENKLEERNFKTPEATIKTYIEARKHGDKKIVESCFDPHVDFNLHGAEKIGTYKIVKKTIYGKKEVENWNKKGIQPPAKLNDVELDVEETWNEQKEMVSYLFRKTSQGRWKIISHSAWNAPE